MSLCVVFGGGRWWSVVEGAQLSMVDGRWLFPELLFFAFGLPTSPLDPCQHAADMATAKLKRHACDYYTSEIVEILPSHTSAQRVAKLSLQCTQEIILSGLFDSGLISMFDASNWFHQAKIASPEFIGSVECFIGKMHGPEMFKLPRFKAIIHFVSIRLFVQISSSIDDDYCDDFSVTLTRTHKKGLGDGSIDTKLDFVSHLPGHHFLSCVQISTSLGFLSLLQLYPKPCQLASLAITIKVLSQLLSSSSGK
jgi:hypothetical protein